MVKRLLQGGHQVVVADNFSTGFRAALVGGELAELDIADAASLDRLFAYHRFDAVLHLASFIQVGESVTTPGKYYANNLAATLTLLQAMVRAGVLRFIFSSTAAVYGDPEYVPIDERHRKQPINPYGRSKWMVEQMLHDFDHAHGLKSVALRYFNAAGADPDGELGERHEPETHLIPLILQVASGRRKQLTVFGRDYPTPDGTCIRDYVHVTDLVEAHALALEHLLQGGDSRAFNLGNEWLGVFGTGSDRRRSKSGKPNDQYRRCRSPRRRSAESGGRFSHRAQRAGVAAALCRAGYHYQPRLGVGEAVAVALIVVARHGVSAIRKCISHLDVCEQSAPRGLCKFARSRRPPVLSSTWL